MAKALKDFPRPPNDNGRGLHGSASTGWTGSGEGYDYWVNELAEMGIKWFKVLDDHGDSIPFCEKLLAAGIFPVVRIIRRDPPPNDVPEPNPGHIGPAEEETVKRLVACGVRYFETNDEPDLPGAWKHNAMPGDSNEAAKLVALNWLFDARLILEAGGLPGLPAVSVGGELDLMGALVALGRQDILSEGCWIAIHNSTLNRPLGYPDDPVNRSGLALDRDHYEFGPFTSWVWWDSRQREVDSIEVVNQERGSLKSPAETILQDHACFREFEYYNHLAIKYLGHSIPVISTKCGILVGRRQDRRYPRVTPDMHRDQTVAMFDFMQRQAPDYYFATTPWLLLGSTEWETDAWNSGFWPHVLKNGTDGRDGIPPMAVKGVEIANRLPVVDAVKAMPKLSRRLPGAQPAAPASTVRLVAPSTDSTVRVPLPPPPERPFAKPATAPAAEPASYTVQPGDTLWRIAEQFGLTWKEIAAFNRIQDPGYVLPGLVLEIPPRNWSASTVQSQEPQAGVVSPLPPDERSTAESEWLPEEEDALSQSSSQVPYAPFGLERSDAYAPPSPSVSTVPLPPQGGEPYFFQDTLKPPLDWDPRLDALNIALEEAQVEAGQPYWRLIRAEYLSMEEANGKHHINYTLLDEQGKPVPFQRVWQGWPEDRADATTNEQGEATIPIWASYAPDRHESGPYVAWVDGLPSDCVQGIGLPFKRQVSFALTWQRVVS